LASRQHIAVRCKNWDASDRFALYAAPTPARLRGARSQPRLLVSLAEPLTSAPRPAPPGSRLLGAAHATRPTQPCIKGHKHRSARGALAGRARRGRAPGGVERRGRVRRILVEREVGRGPERAEGHAQVHVRHRHRHARAVRRAVACAGGTALACRPAGRSALRMVPLAPSLQHRPSTALAPKKNSRREKRTPCFGPGCTPPCACMSPPGAGRTSGQQHGVRLAVAGHAQQQALAADQRRRILWPQLGAHLRVRAPRVQLAWPRADAPRSASAATRRCRQAASCRRRRQPASFRKRRQPASFWETRTASGQPAR